MDTSLPLVNSGLGLYKHSAITASDLEKRSSELEAFNSPLKSALASSRHSERYWRLSYWCAKKNRWRGQRFKGKENGPEYGHYKLISVSQKSNQIWL
jgi:hypothetical protein